MMAGAAARDGAAGGRAVCAAVDTLANTTPVDTNRIHCDRGILSPLFVQSNVSPRIPTAAPTSGCIGTASRSKPLPLRIYDAVCGAIAAAYSTLPCALQDLAPRLAFIPAQRRLRALLRVAAVWIKSRVL